MGLSCGARWAKSMLIMFNLVFWLSGCALLFVGIYTLVAKGHQNLFILFSIDEKYVFLQYLSYALIAIGALIFLVGFCGCCGAMQESKCMLVSYFIFLLLILAAELGIGIMAIYFQDSTLDKLEGKLSKTLRKEYGPNTQFTQAVDYAQTQFDCCGINNPKEDYARSTWAINNMGGEGVKVPRTCCKLSNRNQTNAYLNPIPENSPQCQNFQKPEFHDMGCLPRLKEFLKEQSKLFTGIGIGIACLEIFGMICALCLCKEI